MKSNRTALITALVLFTLVTPAQAADPGSKSALYFPPANGEWEKVDPAEAGWDREKLQALMDYAQADQSSRTAQPLPFRALVLGRIKLTVIFLALATKWRQHLAAGASPQIRIKKSVERRQQTQLLSPLRGSRNCF